MKDEDILKIAREVLFVMGHLDDPWIRFRFEHRTWNPLTDNGDAMWLAVKLNLFSCDALINELLKAQDEPDPYATSRRAIVRAAAEIGRNMK